MLLDTASRPGSGLTPWLALSKSITLDKSKFAFWFCSFLSGNLGAILCFSLGFIFRLNTMRIALPLCLILKSSKKDCRESSIEAGAQLKQVWLPFWHRLRWEFLLSFLPPFYIPIILYLWLFQHLTSFGGLLFFQSFNLFTHLKCHLFLLPSLLSLSALVILP